MILLLFYFDSRSFGLIYLFFHSLIFLNSGFESYTRLRIRLIVFVFDLGLLSW
jgi:hypothetical protein